MSLCRRTANCQAFTYFHREGTLNCFMKTGLLKKECKTGHNFTFSQKCNLSSECSTDKETCAISRMPYFTAGSHHWNCVDNNGKKTCDLLCEDGYDLAVSGRVAASCDASSNTWNLDSPAAHLTVLKNPGCQTCSADPIKQFPIAEGGRWECSDNGWHGRRKKCVPTCDNNKELKGFVFCLRDNMGEGEGRHAPSNNFVQDGALKQYIENTGPLTCKMDTCKQSDFNELMMDYANSHEWDVSLDNNDFTFAVETHAYKAFLRCPKSHKISRTFCRCFVLNGNRKFWCTDLTRPKKC